MTRIRLRASSLLVWFAVTAMSAAPLSARGADPAPKNLNVNFTISGSNNFNASDPATLTITRGVVTGLIILNPFGAGCTVASGSTDAHGKLMLTGTLKPKAGRGSGTFSDTLFSNHGTHTNRRGV